MELLEAIKVRHSVRNYLEKVIEPEKVEVLKCAVDEYNERSGLNIQLCLNDPAVFSNFLARYGSFKNVQNYFALVGLKAEAESTEVSCGYYGQKLVLLAQTLGLNTCWVGLSYNRKKVGITIRKNEKLYLVIALGYGENQGKTRRTKPLNKLCKNENEGDLPHWFIAAMEAVQLAPTAINHQKFMITLQGNTVKAEALLGSYSNVDLGIVKCNFEVGAEAAGVVLGQDWYWK